MPDKTPTQEAMNIAKLCCGYESPARACDIDTHAAKIAREAVNESLDAVLQELKKRRFISRDDIIEVLESLKQPN